VPSPESYVVLVADDEASILMLTTRILARQGYTVISATDARNALDACRKNQGPIHLAILDVMMPGMNGPELAECLKQRNPEIEILFMSGYTSERIEGLFPNMRDAHFIGKPFRPQEIIEKASSILGKPDARTDNIR
jgi:two-component system cell cycle sensor histidine kinase/response regulator CckA